MEEEIEFLTIHKGTSFSKFERTFRLHHDTQPSRSDILPNPS